MKKFTYSENNQHAWDQGLKENARKSAKENAIKAYEANKKPIYSEKLDIQFGSIVEAATYLQTYFFENTKLESLKTYICLLLKNKITKSKYDYGWQYI